MRIWKPTLQQLEAARDKRLRDVLAPGLKILFCGINPSLYSAAVGHHFARPGNRFWPALHLGGFTPRLYSPFEDRELLQLGYGITNVVNRATASAAELSEAEVIAGGKQLAKKLGRHRPRLVAVLGISVYRLASHRQDAKLGEQQELLAGVPMWILPNPSGLNAHYQVDGLARLFARMREFAESR